MLNPLREIVRNLGQASAASPSPFRAEAEQVLDNFRDGRREIEARVGRGDLTVKMARKEAETLASGLGRALRARAEGFAIAPRVFLDRLVEASERRRAAADHASLEGLQRETNQLLRSVLVEQQVQVRRPEFEAKAFTRPVAGGRPAPTLEGLLSFHEASKDAGDEAATEWARRQLEGRRPLVGDPDDQRRIDRATERPDRINPRLVANYVEAMQAEPPERLEEFVAATVSSKEANACVAAFVLARGAAEGSRLRWVRQVLEGVDSFPDVALSTLRALEADARSSDRDAAKTQAEFAIVQAEAEAKLPGLEAPTAEEVARRAAIESRPVARPGEPIGLALQRRGALAGDVADETTIAGVDD